MQTPSGINFLQKHKPLDKPIMYIHVGLPKTGTTSIQQFLKENREALMDIGVLYPATGIHGTGHVQFARSFLNQDYTQRMQDSNLLCASSQANEIKRQIEDEISASGTKIQSVIISAESFVGTDAEGIRRLTQLYQADFQLKIIIYLRRQDRYAESLHSQAYRVREMQFDRNSLLKSGHMHFDHYIRLWTEALGSENLILREFPEQAFDGQLMHGFLEAVSIEEFPVTTGIEPLNRRMGRITLEYIQHHTGLKFGEDIYFRITDLLCKYSQQHPAEKRYKHFYSPQEHQLMLEDCRKSNAFLSETFFNGSLFEDIPEPGLLTEWEAFPGLSEAEVESIDSFLLAHGIGSSMLGRG